MDTFSFGPPQPDGPREDGHEGKWQGRPGESGLTFLIFPSLHQRHLFKQTQGLLTVLSLRTLDIFNYLSICTDANPHPLLATTVFFFFFF